VVHILPDGGLEEHAAAMERLVRTTGVEPDLFAGGGREELIARACRAREERITSRRR
jgi:hypothetical protein